MSANAKSATAAAAPRHRFSFYRAGGVDQVRLDTGADCLALDQLDQKLWMALSCPVKGLEFDMRTLELLDTDKDAHVRPPEILAATKWLEKVLKKPDDLLKGSDGIALANIRTDTPEGQRVLASAKHMLGGLGKAESAGITVAGAMQTADVLAKSKHNGDGAVPPDTIDDAAARKVAEEVLACHGGSADRSGKAGVDKARLEAFFADCAAFSMWARAAEADGAAKLLPLGDDTGAAAATLAAVRAKVDDYFARCRLAAFDSRAIAALNLEEKAYLEVAAKDMSIDAKEVAHFPLSKIEAGKPLPLDAGVVNPAWSGAIESFRKACVVPLLGDKKSLAESDWDALRAKFDAHGKWVAAKAGASVEKLGVKRVREILASDAKAAIEKAIADDLAVAPQIEAMTEVEKLVRLHRDFHKLLNNYVSFTEFYSRKKAIFQAGTLYLDRRSLDLCVHVNDPAKHALLAVMSKSYLAYVDCSRPGGEKMSVVCAFTAGDSDFLFVGRNGIFYDRKGRDWDATIAKIIDNPISIRQAFWSPYKKVLRWIEEQIAKRAAAADAASSARLQSAAAPVASAPPAAPAAPAAPAPKVATKFDVGVVAALGVAVGALTAALSTFLAAFLGLGPWIPLGLIGLILAISGPSMLIAWLKLRQRNLGPILDANGWAVNTLAKVNMPLGRVLTESATLPPGSTRSLTDPYAPKKPFWPKLLLILIFLGLAAAALWKTGLLHDWWKDCPIPPPAETWPHREEKKPAEAPPPPADGTKPPAEGAPAEQPK